MPEVSIKIAGRAYTVSCNPGEEDSLEKAAQLLSMEAETITSQLGTLPEPRLLLMAGLMLGDRTVAVYGEL
ncbi:MAG: cell division protein ZapA, partial [Pseudomonadota bacterium]